MNLLVSTPAKQKSAGIIPRKEVLFSQLLGSTDKQYSQLALFRIDF